MSFKLLVFLDVIFIVILSWLQLKELMDRTFKNLNYRFPLTNKYKYKKHHFIF